MCMPFTQVPNSPLARLPPCKRNRIVTERQSLEKVAKSVIPNRRDRRFHNEQVGTVDGPKQKPPCFTSTTHNLSVLQETLKRSV